MRSRLSLFLHDLSLEELLYIEEETQRRKEKYRKMYTVLSVQASEPVMKANSGASLGALAKDMRRFVAEAAAVGGGTIIGYSPELIVIQHNEVEHASMTCAALFSGLAEFNGRGGESSYQVNLKLGIATGTDTLAPGSPRSVRLSSVVKRANQCGWRSSAGVLIIDEATFQRWPSKVSAMRMAFDVDGKQVYRVTAADSGDELDKYDNTQLITFLDLLRKIGVSMVKYDLVHQVSTAQPGAAGMTELLLQAYNPATNRNQTHTERVFTINYEERMESIKRRLSAMGMALVRQDLFANA